MKNRIELAKYFAELGFKIGVEVGVAEGRYSEILMENIPELELWGIDNYAEYDNKSVGRRRDTQENNRQRAQDRLERFPKYHLIVADSIEAAKSFKNGSLDFVFIDGDHTYDSVKQDIEAWYPKIKPGGHIAGHDYLYSEDVRRAVDAAFPAAQKVGECWLFQKPVL